MLGLQAVLVFAAFLVAVVSATGRAPLWVAVILLAIVELIQVWPA